MASLEDDFARFLASRSWTFQQTEDFEASRECARSIVCKVGWDDDTNALVTYWVMMTKFKVLSNGRDASDIDPIGMGLRPIPSIGIDDLKRQTFFQKRLMKSEIDFFKQTCDLLSATADALWLSQSADHAVSFLADIKANLDLILCVLKKEV